VVNGTVVISSNHASQMVIYSCAELSNQLVSWDFGDGVSTSGDEKRADGIGY